MIENVLFISCVRGNDFALIILRVKYFPCNGLFGLYLCTCVQLYKLERKNFFIN